MTVTVRVVALDDLSPADVEGWSDLASRAAEPNAFLDPGWLLPATHWFPAARDLRVLLAEDADRVRMVLPLGVERGFHRLPVSYATTATPYLARNASVCAPLVDRDDTRGTFEAVLDAVGRRRSGLPGLLELTLFPDGPLLAALLDVAVDRRLPVLERYRLERACLRVPGEDPVAHLSKRRRKHVRQDAAALAERLGGELTVVDNGGDPAATERLLDLEASGWKGDRSRKGAAQRNKPHQLGWFQEATDEMRRRGRLHVFELVGGGTTVYASAVIRSGTGLFGYLDTYDEAHADLGPGVVGRVMTQELVAARGDVSLFDPCIHPKFTVPSTLYPGRRDLVGLMVAVRGPVARTCVGTAPRVSSALRRLRRPRPAAHDAVGSTSGGG